MAAAQKRFNGKVVIITGSSTGMGEAFAKAFAAEGASVSLTGRNVKGLENVAAECRKLGAKVIFTAGDISTDVVRKTLIEKTVSELGKIDILINNAGLNLERKPFLEQTPEYFDTIHNVNLKSVYNLTQLAAPYIIKTKGNIVNISSVTAMKLYIGSTAYGVSKAGLDMLTKSLALELASYGVRVNGVNPGAYATDYYRFMTTDKEKLDEMLKVIAKSHALGRIGKLEELTNYVLFVASDDASFMTGTNVPVDGGNLLGVAGAPPPPLKA